VQVKGGQSASLTCCLRSSFPQQRSSSQPQLAIVGRAASRLPRAPWLNLARQCHADSKIACLRQRVSPVRLRRGIMGADNVADGSDVQV
jgi:hypothetical protein